MARLASWTGSHRPVPRSWAGGPELLHQTALRAGVQGTPSDAFDGTDDHVGHLHADLGHHPLLNLPCGSLCLLFGELLALVSARLGVSQDALGLLVRA